MSILGDAQAFENSGGGAAAVGGGASQGNALGAGLGAVGGGASQGSGGASYANSTQWAVGILGQMGFPATQSNVTFLVSWAAHEGGNWNNTANYNPLNTTLSEPGATSMNSVGVKSFTSWQQGDQATIATLQGYPEVLSALRGGNAMQVNQQGGLSSDLNKWSGGGYTQIGQAGSVQPYQAPDNNNIATTTQDSGNQTMLDYLLAGAQAFVNMGVQYKWGGTATGDTAQSLQTDCSGMVQFLYQSLGVNMPRTTYQQDQVGTQVQENNMQPGDLIFYDYEGPDSHVAIYVGNGKQVAESQTGTPASVQNIDTAHISQIRNVTNLNQAVTAPSSTITNLISAGGVDLTKYNLNGSDGSGGATNADGSVDSGGNPGTKTYGEFGDAPAPIGLKDIPSMNAYISKYWPEYDWILKADPSGDLTKIVTGDIVSGKSSDEIQADLQNTTWWKQNSSSYIQYLQQSAQNPGDFNFSTPGSQAQESLNYVQDLASTAGLNVSDDALKTLAEQKMKYNWSDGQLMAALATQASVNTLSGAANSAALGQSTESSDSSLTQKLLGIAGQYMQTPTNASLQQWEQQILAKSTSGSPNTDSFTAAMQKQAEGQFPTLAQGLASGQSVSQLLDPQISALANTLEVDPSDIQSELTTNPKYSKILSGGTSKVNGIEAAAPMSVSQVQDYARSLPEWKQTANAQQAYAGVADGLMNAITG